MSFPKFSTVMSLVPFGNPMALPRSSRSWTNHIPFSLVFTPGMYPSFRVQMWVCASTMKSVPGFRVTWISLAATGSYASASRDLEEPHARDLVHGQHGGGKAGCRPEEVPPRQAGPGGIAIHVLPDPLSHVARQEE